MSVESDVRKLKEAIEALSKAVEGTADELEKLIKGSAASASNVESASRKARSARFNI